MKGERTGGKVEKQLKGMEGRTGGWMKGERTDGRV